MAKLAEWLEHSVYNSGLASSTPIGMNTGHYFKVLLRSVLK